MDSGNSNSGAPCNHAFRDITNIEGMKSCRQFEEQAQAGTSGENNRKRRRPFYDGPVYNDNNKNEVIHPPKASEPCEQSQKTTISFLNSKLYDSESYEGNDESQAECPVHKLGLRGASSGQISRLSNEADNSGIGPIPRSNSETEDISTESDELKETFQLDVKQFPRHSAHLVNDHKEPTFSDQTSLDLSLLCKNTADIGKRLTHEKSEYISLCGNCPCSLCTKAAYMWSDLIYQDTRGRLSALKSSRKHARILEGKILRQEKTVETSQYQFKKPRSTESDLLQHWTSLFLRTEDTLLCEIMQAQSRLVEIENLKEKFKTDLETMNSQPQNKYEK